MLASVFSPPARSPALYLEMQFCTKTTQYEIEWFANKQIFLAINPGDGMVNAGRIEETNNISDN